MYSTLFAGFILLTATSLTAASPALWDDYDTLLTKHTAKTTLNGVNLIGVDYNSVRNDKSWQALVASLAAAPLEFKTKQHQLAFYINAYNILAIDLVANHWPVDSIKDIGPWYSTVWKVDAGKLGGKETTLHKIEHEVLRKLDEPRIHFAIVCASISCPDLRREAYRPEKLKQQLEEQTSLFVNNKAKGARLDGQTLLVSKIFDWFEEDFESSGGLKPFIQLYLPEIEFRKIDADIDYDWGVNALQ